jgi:hypothetical protein
MRAPHAKGGGQRLTLIDGRRRGRGLRRLDHDGPAALGLRRLPADDIAAASAGAGRGEEAAAERQAGTEDEQKKRDTHHGDRTSRNAQ